MDSNSTRRFALLLAPVLVAGLLQACASSAFHDHWDAGRFEEAAEAFRGDTSLRSDARARYRMALLQLSEDLPPHDPPAARDNLRTLLELNPDPAVRHQAQLLLDLTAEVLRLRHQLQALKSIDLDQPDADTTSLP